MSKADAKRHAPNWLLPRLKVAPALEGSLTFCHLGGLGVNTHGGGHLGGQLEAGLRLAVPSLGHGFGQAWHRRAATYQAPLRRVFRSPGRSASPSAGWMAKPSTGSRSEHYNLRFGTRTNLSGTQVKHHNLRPWNTTSHGRGQIL